MTAAWTPETMAKAKEAAAASMNHPLWEEWRAWLDAAVEAAAVVLAGRSLGGDGMSEQAPQRWREWKAEADRCYAEDHAGILAMRADQLARCRAARAADAGLRARVTALRDEAREEAERPDGDYAFRAANVRQALDAILADTATEETTPALCPVCEGVSPVGLAEPILRAHIAHRSGVSS